MVDREKKWKRRKSKNLNISRTKSFLYEIKTFFMVLEGLSFGEKWKIDKKIEDTSFKINILKVQLTCSFFL